MLPAPQINLARPCIIGATTAETQKRSLLSACTLSSRRVVLPGGMRRCISTPIRACDLSGEGFPCLFRSEVRVRVMVMVKRLQNYCDMHSRVVVKMQLN